MTTNDVCEIIKNTGNDYADLAENLRNNGYNGQIINKLSDDDLNVIFEELKVTKVQQICLRKKIELAKLPKTQATAIAATAVLMDDKKK